MTIAGYSFGLFCIGYPIPDVLRLRLGLGDPGPCLRVGAALPQSIEFLECRAAIQALLDEETAHRESGATDAGTTMHIQMAIRGQRRTNS